MAAGRWAAAGSVLSAHMEANAESEAANTPQCRTEESEHQWQQIEHRMETEVGVSHSHTDK